MAALVSRAHLAVALAEPPVSAAQAQARVEPGLSRELARLVDAAVLEQRARMALRPREQSAVLALARAAALREPLAWAVP